MSLSQAAVGPDRLPWLEDEERPAARGWQRRLPALLAALLLIAALSYWVGVRSRPHPPSGAPAAQRSMTVALPEPRPVGPETNLNPEPRAEADVQSSPAAATQSQVKVSKARKREGPRPETASANRHGSAPPSRHAKAAVRAPVAPTAIPQPLWPARRSAGANGRIIRIGAFESSLQAKRGWWTMVGAYPALETLPAVVVEKRNSRGRPFYRLQIGTASQAHSEVLCQRMVKIRMSCAVIGLPWKPRGVER